MHAIQIAEPLPDTYCIQMLLFVSINDVDQGRDHM